MQKQSKSVIDTVVYVSYAGGHLQIDAKENLQYKITKQICLSAK